MHLHLKAQVIEVSLEEEYGKKKNGLTDYDNKIEYHKSELRLLHNPEGATGVISVREKLEIGSIYEIFLGDESEPEVLETQAFTQSSNPILKL